MIDTKVKEIIDRIIAKYQPQKIILFGSYARGEANFDSDLDLLIVKQTNSLRHKRGIELRQLIRPAILPLDLVILTENEYTENCNKFQNIAQIATQQGIVVYDSK